jgi:hypothetical protein
MIFDKSALRDQVSQSLSESVSHVNKALSGQGLEDLEDILKRFEKSKQVAHWYPTLKNERALPNLDGKTVGSIIEKLFVAVLEKHILKYDGLPPLRINPAKGVDIPDLDLGLKSPSENYCTSEPFFSAYERLFGSEYDVVVLLTDYQISKKKHPLRLTITDFRYLKASQIADAALCKLAKKHRDWLVRENEAWAKKLFRFLAYVNQGDWKAKWLVKFLNHLDDEEKLRELIELSRIDFAEQNWIKDIKSQPLIPDDDIKCIESISKISPLYFGIVDAADNWVVQTLKDSGRYPNENEWNRLLASPLDGQIGMSFALQWRYNFARLFG